MERVGFLLFFPAWVKGFLLKFISFVLDRAFVRFRMSRKSEAIFLPHEKKDSQDNTLS